MKRKEKEKFVYFLLFLVIFFLLFLNLRIFKERIEIEKKAKSLKEELEKLTQKKKEIEEILSKAKTQFFWEEKAREQGFIKEGEEPMIIKFK